MKVPHLDFDSLSIRGYSDSGFANNPDLKSQLGMMILLMDKYDTRV